MKRQRKKTVKTAGSSKLLPFLPDVTFWVVFRTPIFLFVMVTNSQKSNASFREPLREKTQQGI